MSCSVTPLLDLPVLLRSDAANPAVLMAAGTMNAWETQHPTTTTSDLISMVSLTVMRSANSVVEASGM